MISLIADDTKKFMNHLIKTEAFDNFTVLSLDLDTLCRFSIDGLVNKNYAPSELTTSDDDVPSDSPVQMNQYVKWNFIKPIVTSILKQSQTPTGLKVILSLSQEATDEIQRRHSSADQGNCVKGFLMTILFDGKQVKITTGTNYSQFTLDKSTEHAFDAMIQQFFKKHEILMTQS
jgi:hypothetical protein